MTPSDPYMYLVSLIYDIPYKGKLELYECSAKFYFDEGEDIFIIKHIYLAIFINSIFYSFPPMLMEQNVVEFF